MNQINAFIVEHADSSWVFAMVFAVCIIDGFFPPIPSESVVVGLAAVNASSNTPPLVPLYLCAALGAFLGDNIAFSIGRKLGTHRFVTGGPRREKAIVWARTNLERRATILIICARFVPVGRIAVNFSAGVSGFKRKRFVALTTLSANIWAAYSIAIGTFAGHAVENNPLLAAIFGICLAIAFGFVIDTIATRVFGTKHT